MHATTDGRKCSATVELHSLDPAKANETGRLRTRAASLAVSQVMKTARHRKGGANANANAAAAASFVAAAVRLVSPWTSRMSRVMTTVVDVAAVVAPCRMMLKHQTCRSLSSVETERPHPHPHPQQKQQEPDGAHLRRGRPTYLPDEDRRCRQSSELLDCP
jgi:hypothetical protein